MGEAAFWRMTGYRGLYVAAVLVVCVVLLLPLGGGNPGRLPGPDVILVLTIAWAMRRSDHLPVFVLGVTLLMADFLLLRPPGLMAAIVVVAVEFIRARETTWRELPFLVEWAIAAAIIAAIYTINAISLGVFLVPQPSLGQTLIRLIFSVLIYPAVLGIVLYAFRVRRAAQASGAIGARS